MARFENWNDETNTKGELDNTLLLVDAILHDAGLTAEFEVLGGSALVFHSVNYHSTLDIDVCNELDEDVKELIELFVNDGAKEVVILPTNYKSRLVEYNKGTYSNITVKLLSKEDLLVTKLQSSRQKDYKGIWKTGLHEQINYEVFSDILEQELDETIRDRICGVIDNML